MWQIWENHWGIYNRVLNDLQKMFSLSGFYCFLKMLTINILQFCTIVQLRFWSRCNRFMFQRSNIQNLYTGRIKWSKMVFSTQWLKRTFLHELEASLKTVEKTAPVSELIFRLWSINLTYQISISQTTQDQVYDLGGVWGLSLADQSQKNEQELKSLLLKSSRNNIHEY